MKKFLPVLGVLFNDACLFASGYAFGAEQGGIGAIIMIAGFAGAGISIWVVKGKYDE